MKEFFKKHKKEIFVVFLLFILCMAFGITYAYWKVVVVQESENTLTTMCLDLNFEEAKESKINLPSTYPLTEREGSSLTPYTFTITNTCNNDISYQINLDILSDLTNTKTLGLKHIRISLNEEKSKILNNYQTTEKTSEQSTTSKKIKEGILTSEESITYHFRMWMDEATTVEEGSNKEFKSKIIVTSTIVNQNTYKEDILNESDPVLASGLIPITIENDGTVRKADTRTEWYSYANQRWANAVILDDESITYQNGEVIPESNIESYFVWIPKYRYKLWDLGQYEALSSSVQNKVQTIDIIFGDYDTIDKEGECKTPGISGSTGNCKVGDYMTHPAFQAFGVKGLWVGKFETGYKGATNTTSAEVNSNDSMKIIVKPNAYSWRGNTLGNMFMSSYNYKRDLGSHMMKNTEWGSAAYLSHSKYGINKEVNVNNNSAYITGYSATSDAEQNIFPGISGIDISITLPYNSSTGYLASTTGNITGIYDMSGGAYEMMASYIGGNIGSSEFSDVTNSIYSKCLDVYSSSSSETSYQNRILGDAIGEMGPFLLYNDEDNHNRPHNSWYADAAFLAVPRFPWFNRGCNYSCGVLAGQFAIGRDEGKALPHLGYRIVLAI